MSLRKSSPAVPQHTVAKAADDADAPMTPEQINYLKELWRRAGDTDAFDENLTRGEAQKRITALEHGSSANSTAARIACREPEYSTTSQRYLLPRQIARTQPCDALTGTGIQ
jgi:hypothetical protein